MPSFGQNLTQMKKAKVTLVNKLIGESRSQYITVIPGQELLYQQKQTEARIYLTTSPEPVNLDDFPLLASEVGITADTAYQVAMVISYLSYYWTLLVAQMESLRLGTIRDIELAQNKAEIEAAFNQFKARLDVYAA